MTLRVRVVAYNLRGFRDGAERLERVVRSLDADVLLLNETGGRWRLRRFAHALGLQRASDPWSPLRRRAKDAVLARPPWRIVRHHQRRFSGSAWFYPRAALFARLDRDGASLWAISTHLGLRPRERKSHVEQLLEGIAPLGPPVVAGGDLNELPDGRAVRRITERLRDAWLVAGRGPDATIPASVPEARIDYLFVSPDVRVERAVVPQDEAFRWASDHRPVVADLRLPIRADGASAAPTRVGR